MEALLHQHICIQSDGSCCLPKYKPHMHFTPLTFPAVCEHPHTVCLLTCMSSFKRNVLLWWRRPLGLCSAICKQPHFLAVSHLQTEAQSTKQCLADRTAMMRTADPIQHDRGQHVCVCVERGWRAVDECTSAPLHTLTLIYVFSAWRVSKVSAVAWEKESNRFNFSLKLDPAWCHGPETCN